jgi:bifunctional enzyme Fae/Hps
MLSPKKHYIQVALNSSLDEARRIIELLPPSDRIIIEAGTPLIKEYGSGAISELNSLWSARLYGTDIKPYVVADLKCMDRGSREIEIAVLGGAAGAVVLGIAPVETIDTFIEACANGEIDSMIDMMNVDKPYQILRKLKKLPNVVILHRGVDEEASGNKALPIHMINKIKGAFNVMVAIAGGDTEREIQSAVFNGADIVVLWKNFYQAGGNTGQLAVNFLNNIK